MWNGKVQLVEEDDLEPLKERHCQELTKGYVIGSVGLRSRSRARPTRVRLQVT